MDIQANLSVREAAAAAKLRQYGQEHAFRYYDTLTDAQKDALLTQIEKLDFSVTAHAQNHEGPAPRGAISPLQAMEIPEIQSRAEEFRTVGLDAIRAGKVGAVLLAGGMGTRLGSEDPKCMYDIGVTHTVYIMQRLIENTMDVVREAGAYIPFFIMTSDKNHDKTAAFLKEQNFFGYDPAMIRIFRQDMAPATDYSGKVYMESPYQIASSPNGNGGWFASMYKAGLVDVLHERGIEWLNCFAVDNVLQRIADPLFIGATLESGCACGAKVVKLAAPDEKIGTICLEDGQPSIIEYYEMTEELMNAKNPDGSKAYNFGVILNYLFRVKDLEAIMNDRMMLHIVEKKIPYLAEDGSYVKPSAVNGYKFEQLILDLVHQMGTCLPFEVERTREFAPIKNPAGIDSVESARELCRQSGIDL